MELSANFVGGGEGEVIACGSAVLGTTVKAVTALSESGSGPGPSRGSCMARRPKGRWSAGRRVPGELRAVYPIIRPARDSEALG